MTDLQLKRLRKKLPRHYGKIISAKLDSKLIDSQKVVRVLNGEITDPDFVTPVMDAVVKLIENKKRIGKRLTKALNPS